MSHIQFNYPKTLQVKILPPLDLTTVRYVFYDYGIQGSPSKVTAGHIYVQYSKFSNKFLMISEYKSIQGYPFIHILSMFSSVMQSNEYDVAILTTSSSQKSLFYSCGFRSMAFDQKMLSKLYYKYDRTDTIGAVYDRDIMISVNWHGDYRISPKMSGNGAYLI